MMTMEGYKFWHQISVTVAPPNFQKYPDLVVLVPNPVFTIYESYMLKNPLLI